MVGLFELVYVNLPILGEVGVAKIILYFLGFIAIVALGFILYLLGALEKSLLGGAGGSYITGGGSRPQYDDYDEVYEDEGDHKHHELPDVSDEHHEVEHHE